MIAKQDPTNRPRCPAPAWRTELPPAPLVKRRWLLALTAALEALWLAALLLLALR